MSVARRQEGAGALGIARVSKSFAGRTVLDGVTLAVGGGKLLAVLGRSGSGKTTLLRIVAGFERPDAGTVSIGGREVAGARLSVPVERRRIGYVAQEGALFPHLDVAGNVLFGLDRATRRRPAAAEPWLELVGLGPAFARRTPAHLSGGEQQRVALARALATRPALVLLDEPFSALDAGLRAETRRAVAAALAEVGATALLVTHDQPEALSMGDQVAVLRDGRLVQCATPEALYRTPADPALAGFVGEAVLLAAEIRDGCADTPFGRLALSAACAAGRATVMLRPEQFVLAPGAGPQALVRAAAFLGAEARLELALGDGTVLVARMPAHLSPAVGAWTGVAVSGTAMAWAGDGAEGGVA